MSTTPVVRQQALSAFYLLNYVSSLRTYAGTYVDVPYRDSTNYSRGIARLAEPVRVEWREGAKEPSDVIWVGVAKLVVSPRFLGVLGGFTGWSTYPVEVYDG